VIRSRFARAALTLVVLAAAVACSGGQPQKVNLPPPIESSTVGVGDVFEMRVVGEDKLPITYTVASDGTVDLPYVERMKVIGLEPQQIADAYKKKLKDGDILKEPSVSILMKEYNSKRIEVFGEVQKPGSFPHTSGMTLLRAISLAGGFNAIANKDKIVIRRKVDGHTQAVMVSAGDIMENRLDDIPLQAGDTIDVKQRAF
jgi:polysaccharide export outer membrane protein